MNFFKRLKLKLEQAADRKRAAREGAQVAENTFRTPIIEQAKVAPAPLVFAEPPVRNIEDPEDPSVPPEPRTNIGNAYLAKYTDVAGHPYFGVRPQRHYQFFGSKEGRIWEQPLQPAPTAPAPAPAPEYPKVVKVQGAAMMLNAPIHPEYEPPMSAIVFGSYGSHVSDPSNAPPGMPSRSPSGWPLVYPGLHWDAAKQAWSGTPIGPVRYASGESSFDTEEQALANSRYITQRKRAPADPGWQKVHENMAQSAAERRRPAADAPPPPANDGQTEIPL